MPEFQDVRIDDVVRGKFDRSFQGIVKDIRKDHSGRKPSALVIAGRTDKGTWIPVIDLVTTHRPNA